MSGRWNIQRPMYTASAWILVLACKIGPSRFLHLECLKTKLFRISMQGMQGGFWLPGRNGEAHCLTRRPPNRRSLLPWSKRKIGLVEITWVGCMVSVLPVAHRGKLPVVAELAVDVVILPWGKPTHHNSPFLDKPARLSFLYLYLWKLNQNYSKCWDGNTVFSLSLAGLLFVFTLSTSSTDYNQSNFKGCYC